MAKAASKCELTRIKEFNRCKKKGLKKGTIQDMEDLAACLGSDPKGKIAKACSSPKSKLSKAIAKTCENKGVDLFDAFPGCGTASGAGLGVCIDEAIECRVCEALNQADGLGSLCATCD